MPRYINKSEATTFTSLPSISVSNRSIIRKEKDNLNPFNCRSVMKYKGKKIKINDGVRGKSHMYMYESPTTVYDQNISKL